MLLVSAAAVYVAAARRRAAYQPGQVDYGDAPEGVETSLPEYSDPVQVPSIMDTMADVVQDAAFNVVDTMRGVEVGQAERNVQAFLTMIRKAEGTWGSGGYGALFGWPQRGRSFDPWKAQDHPRQYFTFTDKAGRTLRTSAAGAYQVTATTWDDAGSGAKIRASRGIRGFNPTEQDEFAIGLLELDGALSHVQAGRLDKALAIARRRWASLPGAGYAQPERSEQYVRDSYVEAGGVIA